MWVGLIGIYTILLFPNGKVLSPRWRVVAWIGAFGILASSVLIAMLPGPLDSLPQVINPFGVNSSAVDLEVLSFVVVLIPLSIVLAAVSMILRYRRSRGIERLQLKWFMSAVAVIAVLYAAAFSASFRGGTGQTSNPWVRLIQDLALTSFALLPIATGVAVLKYRLYEIDRLINRSLVYGLLTIVLASVYVLTLLILQTLLSRFLHTDLLIAASTLVAVGVSRPLRNRLQRFIDRRFYRLRYDAQLIFDSLARRLRANSDARELEQHLLDAVTRTVHPKSARLWFPRKEASDLG